MADGGEILFHFKGDDKQLQNTIDNVSKSLNSLSTGSLESIGNGFMKLGGIVTATATAIVGFGASYNAEIESITMSLETLLGNADQAQMVMQQIKKDASTTPFDVTSLAKGEQMLISTGLSAEESRESMLALGNAISATGGDSSTMTRMIANLQQIQNAGKATALDIRQFAYAGIDIYGLLADSMGKSTAEIQEMMSSGKIGYKEITDALKKASSEGGRFYGAMEKQSHTLNGMISNFKDNLGNLTGTLSSGFTNAIKNILPSINNVIDRINDLLGNNARFQQLSDTLSSIAKSISLFIDNLDENQLNAFIDGLVALAKVSPLMIGLGSILPGIGNAIDMYFGSSMGIANFATSLVKGIPVLQQIMNIINVMVSPLLNLVTGFAKLGVGMTAVVGILGLLDQQMNGTLTKLSKEFADKIPTIIETFINKFTKALPQIIKTGQKILSNLVKGLTKALPSLIKGVDEIIKAINDTLLTNGPEIAELVTNGILKLTETIYQNEGNFVQAVFKILQAIMKSIKDNLPSIMKLSQQGINDMLQVLAEELPTFMTLGMQLIISITQGLMEQLPVLIDRIPIMVEMITSVIISNLPIIVEGGIRIIGALIDGIKKTTPSLTNLMGEIAKSILNAFLNLAKTSFTQAGTTIVNNLGNGINNAKNNVLNKLRSIGSSILSIMGNFSLWSTGSNLLTGLWNGMSSKVSWILSKVGGIASSILSKVRSIFGVHSPSKEFAWIGEMNAEGLIQGMLGNQNEIQGAINGMFNLQPTINPTMTIQQESPFNALLEYEQRPVLIDVRADEGIIVQKATQGFREFQRANGRLPF